MNGNLSGINSQPKSASLSDNPTAYSLLECINTNVNKLLEKKVKQKKNTYYPITDDMFKKEILPVFNDFPHEKKDLIFSDGEKNYVKIGNKKHELNKKNFLKFRNTIL
jgi:hypothetical protein